MTMQNGMSPVLRLIAHGFLYVAHHLGHATMMVGRFRTALAGAGAGAAFVGVGALKGMAHIVDHGGEVLKIPLRVVGTARRRRVLTA